MGCYRFLLILCLTVFSFPLHAYQPDFEQSIPDPLKPWVDWVRYDQPNYACPFKAKNASQKKCLWPATLSMVASDNQLHFKMISHSYGDGWLMLPGGEGFWSTGVSVNGVKASVIDMKGRPALYLKPGRYEIEGRVPWKTMPASILVPKETGLIALTVNDKYIPLPRRDKSGRIWLVEQKLSKRIDAEDKLGISVYRHLQDGIPFVVETQVKLEVSGNPREALLGIVQLPGFDLMAVRSPLPARVEDNGRLRIQLRPGSWTLSVIARAKGDIAELPLPEMNAVWPSEELWSFQPKPALRLARIEGAESIDPQQTNIPDAWKRWKAYRLIPGQMIKLVTIRRGDPEPAPNRLNLTRTAWLDFDGEGLLFQDQLNGKLSRDWRLSMSQPYELGNVAVKGEPQVVTEVDGVRGIELRDTHTDLQAVSYVNLPIGHKLTLPASGWLQDFDGLSLNLNLPPGWQLLAASHGDVVRNAWLNKWKVWDVFLVLITTAALIKLRGVVVALLSAVAFVLIYPEEPGILWLWLNVIAVLALLTVLKPSNFHRLVVLYGRLSVLGLLLVCVPFLISQARTALYPQLERGYYASATAGYHHEPIALAAQQMPIDEEDMMIQESVNAYPASAIPSRKAVYREKKKVQRLVKIDPNAAAQTGPSVPQWRWNSASIRWNGPVTSDQQVTMYLIKPFESRVVAVLRVLLLVAIALGLFKGWRSSGLMNGVSSPSRNLFSVMLVFGFGLMLSPQPVSASGALLPIQKHEFPTQPLMEALKQRLAKSNDCTPHCVAVNQARLSIEENQLFLIMDVDAIEPVQIQLPHAKSQWLIQSVTLNDEIAPIRNENEAIWLALSKGTQRIILQGRIDETQALQLQFPTKVHNLMMVTPQWKVRGMENGRVTGGALYLEPLNAKTVVSEKESDALPPNVITPFVRVQRQLRLGLNWYVETKVERIAPADGAIKLQVPLIEGESVTTQKVTVRNGLVTVSLAPGQHQFVWYSALDKRSQINLVAPENVNWVETWQLEAAAIWHVDAEGLAAIKPSPKQKQFLPRWFPLPGESVKLTIGKPKAADGVTTTIDQAKLVVHPGRQESSYQLDLSLRSSKGTEQRIKLQDNAKVLSVTVDGEAQPSQEHGTHLVIPINPGKHQLNLQWREPTEGHFRFAGPNIEIDGLLSNIEMSVDVPRSQWVLLLGGPQLGPAVLIWGELLVIVLLALGLSRIQGLPLKTYEWVLLAMGLCAGWIEAAIIVVLWFVALKKRQQIGEHITPFKFNVMQLALVALTGVSLMVMLGVIPMGLMGSPDMGIVGNGSSHYFLRWYQDEAANILPSFWWMALPLWCYRVLMLLWSLWLAVAILKWLKWAWLCFSKGGVWKKKHPLVESVTEKTDESNLS